MLKLRALAIGLATFGLLQFGLAGTASAGEGYASWYGEPYHGRTMANGQVFDMHDPTTTASNEFPFGTWLRVTNPRNGNWVEVQVRDRGAFRWALDLSYAAFAKLAPPAAGMVWVTYEVIPGPGEPPVAAAAPEEPAPEPAAEVSEPAAEASEVESAPEASADAPAPSEQAAVVAEPAPAVATAPPSSGLHTIGPGETLSAIARRFGLKTLELAAWNGLEDPNLLRSGQVLRLAPPELSEQPGPVPVGASFAVEPYIVQEGDVLWRIAEYLGVDSHALARANNLGPESVLRIGQRLAVPSDAVYHEVEPGDTLSRIAHAYDTSSETLVYLNELSNPDLLVVGQRLRVR